jgi:aspartate racemase
MDMRKIGILGGVGPQATSFIYRSIIEQATEKGAVNNNDYPYVVVASVPVPDFISDKANIPKAKEMLVEAARGLVESGCEILCIGSNTAHILLEDIAKDVQTPFLSMVELVAKECDKRGFKKVALLGTPVLIESGLYNDELGKHDIELITPNEDQEAVCDEVIRCIIGGKSIDEVKEQYVAVLNSMFSLGAEAIILGCTELPMVLNYEALGNRIISSDELLAKGIVDYFYAANN